MSYLVADVSKYNEITNYTKFYQNTDGVIIRAGYRTYNEAGVLVTDPKFETYYEKFSNFSDSHIGVYWYTQAITEEEAREEAEYVYQLIEGKRIVFPIYVLTQYANETQTGRADLLDHTTRTRIIVAFCEAIKEFGFRAGIKATDSWFRDCLDLEDISDRGYSFIVSKYSEEPPIYVENYDAWNYTEEGEIARNEELFSLSTFYNNIAGWDGGGEAQDISTKEAVLAEDNIPYTGNRITPGVTIEDLIMGIDFMVVYSNNINAGTATATIIGVGNYYGSITLNYTIEPYDVSLLPMRLTSTDPLYYNKGEIKPEAVLNRGHDLEVGKDYVLSYFNNINASDQAKVIATGIRNYKGTNSINFTINPKDINEVIFYLDSYEYMYTSDEIRPEVKNDEELSSAYDYSLEYLDNILVGEASINIIGKNNYTNTQTIYFTIKESDISNMELILFEDTFIYRYGGVFPLAMIPGLSRNIDYILSYEDNDKVGTGKVIATGTGQYTGTLEKTFTILPYDISDLTIELDSDEYKYTSDRIKPKTIIVSPETTLVEDADYTVKYSNNLKIGTANISVTGIGNYIGYLDRTFEIVGRSILDNVVFSYGERNRKTYYKYDEDILVLTKDPYPYDTGILTLTVEGVKIKEFRHYVVNFFQTEKKEAYNVVTFLLTGIGEFYDDVVVQFKAIDDFDGEVIITDIYEYEPRIVPKEEYPDIFDYDPNV